MRLEKPHSLSYHDNTRTNPPSITWVCFRSKVELLELWLKSTDTSGSSLVPRMPFSRLLAAAADLAAQVKGRAELAGRNRQFWRSYYTSTFGVCLFAGGLLILVILLVDLSPFYFQVALLTGIVLIGLASFGMVLRGLLGIRRTHRAVATSFVHLEEQPDLSPTEKSRLWSMYTKTPFFSRHLNTRRSVEAYLKR